MTNNRYTQREFQALDRDAYYATFPDRSGGPNGDREFTKGGFVKGVFSNLCVIIT